MKILYGITKSNWGGAQKYVHDMAIAARDAGHDVAVLCGGDGVMVQKLRKENVRVITIPGFGRDIDMLGDAKRLWFIIQTVRKEKPDVFHINSAKMGGAGIFTGRLLRVPKIIFTAHGWAFNEPRKWWQKLIIEDLCWLTVLFSHKTICVSEAIKRDMETKPFVRNKLIVIHHGADSFKLDNRKDRSNVVIGTISELHKVKGLDISLRAFTRAFKYTDVTFEIIGGGDEKENLEDLVKELGVDGQVKFLGFRENAREYLSNFDIFVLSSRSEALGYVLLEAAQAKLPVIASRVGGIPEIIKDNETGVLVPRENVLALANTMKRLADSSEERKRLGDNLYDFVSKNFSKKEMIEKTLKTYSSN